MKSRVAWTLCLVVLGTALYGAKVLATPATVPGFSGTTLAKATYGEIFSAPAHDPRELAGAHLDQGIVRPLRPAEHMGPHGLQQHVHSESAPAGTRIPAPASSSSRRAASPPTTATTRPARRTYTPQTPPTTHSSIPAAGTFTSSATRAAPSPRRSRCSSSPREQTDVKTRPTRATVRSNRPHPRTRCDTRTLARRSYPR